MPIILIDDDKRISDFILKGLEENDHFVTLCKSAEDFLSEHTFVNLINLGLLKKHRIRLV